MLRAVYGGRTVWTGEAHRIGVAEVELQAAKRIPPIPGGAAIFCDCPEVVNRFMGYVREILPAKMERWLLKLDAADAAVGADAAADVASAMQAAEAAGADAAPATFHGGTPIAALRELSSARTWAAIQGVAETVEALAVMSDEALLALSGVGTRTLSEIRRAIDAALADPVDA